MTIEEAIDGLQRLDGPYCGLDGYDFEAIDMAIAALEEVKQYRAFGSPENVADIFSLCKTLQEIVKKYSEYGTSEDFRRLKEAEEEKEREERD